jgi:exosortase/archaeosortase family protein
MSPKSAAGHRANGTTPLLYIAAGLAGGWAAEGWLLQRWVSGQLWIPVVVLGVWAVQRCTRVPVARERCDVAFSWLVASTGLLTAYALLCHTLPRLLSTGLLTTSLACIALAVTPQPSRSWSWLPLAIVILPLGPSLDFFCAYPLRRVSGVLAEGMLWGQAQLDGLALSDGTRQVLLDAPCSGIHMLGVGLLLATLLAGYTELTLWRTGLLLVLTLMAIVLGNALRAASLFLVETRFPLGELFHSGVGLIIFLAVSLAMMAFAWRLRVVPGAAPDKPERVAGYLCRAFFFLSAVAAAASPLLAESKAHRGAPPELAGIVWPKTWEGAPLVAAPIPPEWAGAENLFGGRMAQFRCGEAMVLLRLTPEVSRSLHESRQCYEAFGWHCATLPGWRDPQGRLWSSFSATHPDGRKRVVRECFLRVSAPVLPAALEDLPARGHTWPDASSWYWASAIPGTEPALNLAITRVAPQG